MSKIQRVAGTALTSVALVSLAACGGGSSKSAASSGKAAAKSSSTGTASGGSGDAATGQTVSGTELAQKVKAATGPDYAADYQMTMKMDKGSMTGSGVVSSKGGKSNMKMSLNAGGKTINEIAADGVLYMQVNGQWYKVDGTSGTQGAASKLVSQGATGQISDEAKKQQWKVVSSDSNGTTYEATLQPDQINRNAASLGVSPGPTSSATVAEKFTEQVDAKGRLVKTTIDMPGTMNMTYVMSNYRAPETITAPAGAKSLSGAGFGN